MSLEDVRQEALLICLEIAAGESDYDPEQGTYPQYVMGRLWGMTLRWQNPVMARGHGGDEKDSDPEWFLQELIQRNPHFDGEAADPLEILSRAEEEQERDRQHREILAGLQGRERGFAALLLDGQPIEAVAALYGMTPRAVRYRITEMVL